MVVKLFLALLALVVTTFSGANAQGCLGYAYQPSGSAVNIFEFGTNPGGQDKAYSCRVDRGNNIIPGEYNANQRHCRINENNAEVIVTTGISVLANFGGANLHFNPSTTIPERGAVQGGTIGGEAVYAIRCQYLNGWLAGTYRQSVGRASGTWNGQVVQCTNNLQFLVCD